MKVFPAESFVTAYYLGLLDRVTSATEAKDVSMTLDTEDDFIRYLKTIRMGEEFVGNLGVLVNNISVCHKSSVGLTSENPSLSIHPDLKPGHGEVTRQIDERLMPNGLYGRFLRLGKIVDIGQKGHWDLPPFLNDAEGLDIDTPGYDGAIFPAKTATLLHFIHHTFLSILLIISISSLRYLDVLLLAEHWSSWFPRVGTTKKRCSSNQV